MDSMKREVADMLSPRFGEQVVAAYRGGRLLHATGPGTRTLFVALTSVMIVALALLTLGRVEMVAMAWGCTSPAGGPTEVVAFVSESDRLALTAGLAAHVTIDRFDLSAHVTRVAIARARATELTVLLGDDHVAKGSVYRIDLVLDDAPELERARPLLRPGMLVEVRVTLRTERPITFILQPLRRWLE